ncbi:MAG: MarR family transcriptional regulator [Candidatus Cloacimonetes bacterium]|nr:MarR family transcriptional regulator [Candidatus Cloacimonadota bacterium]
MDKKYGYFIALNARVREKANEFIIRETERLGVVGLAPSHGDILINLMLKGPMKMKDLADLIHRKKNTVTTLVEKLIVLDYVEKLTDEKDNRIKMISLTNKGKSLEEIFFTISENLITTVFKDMTDEEKNSVMNGMKKIYENLK